MSFDELIRSRILDDEWRDFGIAMLFVFALAMLVAVHH